LLDSLLQGRQNVRKGTKDLMKSPTYIYTYNIYIYVSRKVEAKS